MTGPRTKRQFAGAASDPSQRSITSFFSKASSSPSAPVNTAPKPSKQAALNGPHLPTQVQTDLLTVGMRVRKAVPEGYKTGSTYGGFTLWAEDNTGTSNTHSADRASATPSTAAYSYAMRELEPFCGINKVGGLAFQPAYSRTLAVDNEDDNDLDAIPGLTSSQDTIGSTASHLAFATERTVTMAASPPATRKRIFTSEEDEVDGDSGALPYRGPVRRSCDSQEGWLEEEISPRSLAPPAGLWENARVLAVPRRPKQQQQGGNGGFGGRKPFAPVSEGCGGPLASAAAMGQENVMVVVGGVDGNDFEEASFLDYGVVADARMDIE